jgi:lysophospholipase L1-like esterase
VAENEALGLFVALPCLMAGLLLWLRRHLKRRAAPARWPHVLLANLLSLALLLALATLAGEIYFRFIYDSTDSLLYTKVSRRWMQRYWHDNGNQLRDNVNYQRQIPPGKRRITFVGDSFTAGHGIKNVEDRFVNRLRRAHPDWDIHMLAKPGFDTGDELTCLDFVLTNHWQIDQVVLVYCLNDISDLMPQRYEAFQRVNAQIEQSSWLVQNSYLMNIIAHRINLRRNPFMSGYYDLVRDGYRGPMWEEQKERLTAFRDMVESHGGRLSVVTFPFLNDLGPNYGYQFVHDELDQFWRGLHVPHLDLLALYRQYTPEKITVNRLDAHPNEFAHAIATPVIGKFLEAQLAIKPDTQGSAVGHSITP